MRRFEMREGDSAKFWEITQDGCDVTVRFGKVGTAGQTKTKTHPTEAAATKDHDALVREKTKKGYQEAGGGAAPKTPATRGKAPAAAAPAKPTKAEAAPGAGAKPKEAKSVSTSAGPRPLCTAVASCRLESGRILVLAGEDISAPAPDGYAAGRTYVFDAATLSSEETAPMRPGTSCSPSSSPGCLVPLAGERALLLEPWALWEDGAWTAAEEPELPPCSAAYPLPDGSTLLLESEEALAHRVLADGEVVAIGAPPELRNYDAMHVRADGKLWFGGGEGEEGPTRRTMILDPATWTFSAGPELPLTPQRGGFGGAGGRAFVCGDAPGGPSIAVWDGKAWSAPRVEPELARGVVSFHALADGTHFTVRATDGAIVALEGPRFEPRVVGHARLGQDGARMHELPDGRVLFLGGKLVGGIAAEPEVWDRARGACAPLPGRSKEAERQVAQLAKVRERQAKEQARDQAILAAQARARG